MNVELDSHGVVRQSTHTRRKDVDGSWLGAERGEIRTNGMNIPFLLTVSLGNLEISTTSAVVLIIVSLLFLVSFAIVSLKNDSKGMMEWMFENKSNEQP